MPLVTLQIRQIEQFEEIRVWLVSQLMCMRFNRSNLEAILSIQLTRPCYRVMFTAGR